MAHLLSLAPVGPLWAVLLVATTGSIVISLAKSLRARRAEWQPVPAHDRYSPTAVTDRSASDMERVRQLLETHDRDGRYAHQRPPLR